jgi:hypothetical protein
VCAEEPKGTSCADVRKTTHVTSVDGATVIWSQTTTADGTVLGTATSGIGPRAVLVVVGNIAQPGLVALKAMHDLLPRL